MADLVGNDPQNAAACERKRMALRAGSVLSLAAAPAFATMAVLTAAGGPADTLCSAVPGSPLTGMVPMYLLMSASHLAPWLTLLSGRHAMR